MATRLHAGGDDNIPKLPSSAGPWYMSYVNYAIANGIIKSDTFQNYTDRAVRAEVAHIFANMVTDSVKEETSALRPPDVNAGDPYAQDIFLLYSVGILSGNDDAGTFAPDTLIRRSHTAQILWNMYSLLN
jgi:hypothetical protein